MIRKPGDMKYQTLITFCPETMRLHGYKHWVANRDACVAVCQISRFRAIYGDPTSLSRADFWRSAVDNLQDEVEDWIRRQGLNGNRD